MIELVKSLYWDMASHWGRDQYMGALLRNIPGMAGIVLRRSWYTKKFGRAGAQLTIYPGATILNARKIECGNRVHIGFFNYGQAGGGRTFGNDVILGPYTKIWSQNHNYKDPHMPVLDQGYTFMPVVIGDDVWVGANAFIMPGVVLGDRCVVAANSVVGRKEYPAGTVLAGYPARKIGER